MITRIKIDGFKSFSDFEVELKPFNVIVGANGSGKSNLLDALKLLRNLTEGSIAEAFSKQRGTPSELFTRYPDGTSAQEMSFEIDLFEKDSDGKYARLNYTFTIAKKDTLRKEKLVATHQSISFIEPDEDGWFKDNVHNSFLELSTYNASIKKEIYQSSNNYSSLLLNFMSAVEVLGASKEPLNFSEHFTVTDILYAVAVLVRGFKNLSFINLAPQNMSLPSATAGPHSLAENGANLAAALHQITHNDKWLLKQISRSMYSILPTHKKIRVLEDKIQDNYYIELQTNDNTWFNARLLSEGTLRVLALLVLRYDETQNGVVCLEEPEQGVHPLRIRGILKILKEISTDLSEAPDPDDQLRQVIITSHSPVLLSKALELEGNVCLLYTQMVGAVNYIPNQILKITRMHQIQAEDSPRKLTLAIGKRHLYAKQVIDYINSVHSKE